MDSCTVREEHTLLCRRQRKRRCLRTSGCTARTPPAAPSWSGAPTSARRARRTARTAKGGTTLPLQPWPCCIMHQYMLVQLPRSVVACTGCRRASGQALCSCPPAVASSRKMRWMQEAVRGVREAAAPGRRLRRRCGGRPPRQRRGCALMPQDSSPQSSLLHSQLRCRFASHLDGSCVTTLKCD